MANDNTNKISTLSNFELGNAILANSLKLENHTSQDIILSKWNRGLFANCYYTMHGGLNVLKHITHTHTHTHTQGVLQFEERVLRLALICYLITLPEVDHSRFFAIFTAYRYIHQFPANNRDLFGLLAFKLSWTADLVFPRGRWDTSGAAGRVVAWCHWGTLSWLAVSLTWWCS